jgi:hypothetical protein
MRNLGAPAILLLLALAAPPAGAQLLEPGNQDAPRFYDRDEIPGHYTIGFYSDENGSSEDLKIAKDATTFEVYIGVTGDSTRVFSGLAMSLDLPYGVELDGPVMWEPRDEMKIRGDLLDPGVTVAMNRDCAMQKGRGPAILGRLRLRMQPGIDEAVLAPAAHRQHGLSVELCSDKRAWPKPYAEAIPLKVKRKLSLWDRITGWFD